MSKKDARKDARDVAFKLIFEYTFTKEVKGDMIDEYAKEMMLDDDMIAYIREVYFGVINHFDELVEKISANSLNFSIERVFKVDLALLLLAIYEIEHIESIPFKVSVSEALNLAKNYSTEKSVKFINGILSKFARE